DVGPLLARGLEGFGPGAGGGDPEPRLGQMIGHQSGDVRLVVDHEDAMGHVGLLVRSGALSATGLATRVLVWDRLRSAARSRSVRMSASSCTTASRMADKSRPCVPMSRRSR